MNLQLMPDYHWTRAKLTLDTFTAACQYNLQTADHKYSQTDKKTAIGKQKSQEQSEIVGLDQQATEL